MIIKKKFIIMVIVITISMMFISCNRFEGRELDLDNERKLSVISTDAYRLGIEENDSTIIVLPEELSIPIKYEVIEYEKKCEIIKSVSFNKTNIAYITVLPNEGQDNLIYLRPFLARDSLTFDDNADYWLYFVQPINDDNGLDEKTLLISENYNNNFFDLVLSLVEE